MGDVTNGNFVTLVNSMKLAPPFLVGSIRTLLIGCCSGGVCSLPLNIFVYSENLNISILRLPVKHNGLI